MPPVTKGKLASEDVVISMTKLHRILRPLRTKAVALAEALNQPSIRHAITGGSSLRSRGVHGRHQENILPSSSSPASCFYPTPSPKRTRQTRGGFTFEQPFGHLAYIPDPTRAASQRLLSNQDSSRLSAAIDLGIAHARLSDKIVAVVTAFSGLLKQIYPSMPTVDIVPSLRSLCGMVVGNQIEQVGDEGSDDSSVGSDEDAEAVDKWYQAIPEHLRRFVVMGHAIDLVETALPMSLPRLWEDLLDCCCKYGTLIEIEAILLRLLKLSLGGSPKPMPYANQHFSPTYIVELSQRFAQATTDQRRGCFTNLLVRAIKFCDNHIVWGHDGIRTYVEVTRDAFGTIAVFDALLSADIGTGKTRTRLRHWVKLLLDIDIALPPDEDIQDDAFLWVRALSCCAIRLLKKSMNQFDSWRSAALCLGLHAFVRTGDQPSIQDDILQRLRTLSEKIYAEIAISKLSNANTLFSIIFPCLDRHYFFDSIYEYARAMRETDCLHPMESMFISSSLAFASRCARQNAYDEDLEPLLDDNQLHELRDWRAKAGMRCKSQDSLALHALHALRTTSRPAVQSPVSAPIMGDTDMTSPFAYIPKKVHRSKEVVSLVVQQGVPIPQQRRKRNPQSSAAGSRFLSHLVAHSVTEKVSEDSAHTPKMQDRSSSSESDENSCTSSSCGSLLSPEFDDSKFTHRSGGGYAQPPSWVTDPQSLRYAEAAPLSSKHSRASASRLDISKNTVSYDSSSSIGWDGEGSDCPPEIPAELTSPAPHGPQKYRGGSAASSAISRSIAPPDVSDTHSTRFPQASLLAALHATGSNFGNDLSFQAEPPICEPKPLGILAAGRRRPRVSEPDPLDLLSARPPKKPRLAVYKRHGQ